VWPRGFNLWSHGLQIWPVFWPNMMVVTRRSIRWRTTFPDCLVYSYYVYTRAVNIKGIRCVSMLSHCLKQQMIIMSFLLSLTGRMYPYDILMYEQIQYHVKGRFPPDERSFHWVCSCLAAVLAETVFKYSGEMNSDFCIMNWPGFVPDGLDWDKSTGSGVVGLVSEASKYSWLLGERELELSAVLAEIGAFKSHSCTVTEARKPAAKCDTRIEEYSITKRAWIFRPCIMPGYQCHNHFVLPNIFANRGI
jgi:hypothetical protein